MTKQIFTIGMLIALFLTSCKETPKQETVKTIETVTDEIVHSTSTDKDGKKLEMSFNNTKDIATLNFNGETIELIRQKSASGIWYKNDTYELRGKGNDIELKKNGMIVFKHLDEIENISVKDKEGQTLNITFNNTDGTAKIYLNGGEQIDLIAEKAASGIWYKNDQYELRGKGENLELTKNEETIFKN
ncbi:MAG: MliC family protein [Mesonia sp.]|uniref:MliC family protein n=1 Tax=Mesonia sp. TaxID=1960830 RepID=UPI003F9CE9AC